MIEYVSAIHFLEKEVVSQSFELKFVTSIQLRINFTFLATICQLRQLRSSLARRIIDIAIVGGAERAALK